MRNKTKPLKPHSEAKLIYGLIYILRENNISIEIWNWLYNLPSISWIHPFFPLSRHCTQRKKEKKKKTFKQCSLAPKLHSREHAQRTETVCAVSVTVATGSSCSVEHQGLTCCLDLKGYSQMKQIYHDCFGLYHLKASCFAVKWALPWVHSQIQSIHSDFMKSLQLYSTAVLLLWCVMAEH